MTCLSHKKRWRLSILSLMLLLFHAALVVAQDDTQQQKPAARKLDEFAMAYGCDHGARLDNFAIELMNNPKVLGYVICYGPESSGSGSGDFRCRITTDYLVSTRGLAASRIQTVYGGRYKDMRMSATEFWIVPPGADLPEPQKFENEAKTFNGKFAERNAWDNVGMDESLGPSIGDISLASFADVLRMQPETRAYIVAYSMEGAAPGAWRRAAKEIAERLETNYKISADRIKIVRGGYDGNFDESGASARVQLWVVPANAPPPVVDVKEPEPRPAAAMRIGEYGDYNLSNDDYARRAFEGFGDVLRGDEQLRACVILYPPKRDEKQAKEDEETGTERADLNALIEKWRTDLEQKYGIDRNRLFVIVDTADEYRYGTLETWIVPPGAQLPNPYAVEEEMVDTQEEMTEEDVAEEVQTEEALPPQE